MADDDTIPTDVEDNIDRSLGDVPRRRSTKVQPTYQILGDTKIPTAKEHGKVWKSRYQMGKKATEPVAEAWSEALRYFNNDQLGHRKSVEEGVGNLTGNQRLNRGLTETENVVYSNITTMVPALYARNPKIEITTENEDFRDLAVVTERLVNELFARKTSPGVGLKRKAKRCIVTTLLTNRSWLVVNWIKKNDSSEQALLDLQGLAKKLEKAKTAKAIKEVEGQLMALEESIDVLRPSGPELKFKLPTDVIIDPNAMEIDLSDAQWIIITDFLSTSFIKARFGQKRGQDTVSIFQPSHVMKLGEKETDDKPEDFSIFETDKKGSDFGFDDEDAFIKAQMTQVAFVWDKVTRRVFMYNMKDWTWPIWVWDDPLQLDRFFPAYALTFFESPKGPVTKGEVTYYLDQQDAINEIVDEERRARRWASRNVFFDSNRISREDVEAVLKGDDSTARGIDLPDGVSIKDLIFTVPVPSLQFKEIFDKESKYQAIDRISSTSEVLRGSQFKTNTTNRAVDANVSSSNMRIDEKSDEIEDWIGDIGWGIAQLCLINMSKETVAGLVGRNLSENWQNLTPSEISGSFSPRIVGGTTKKPTSQAKKEEAIEVAQVLGQFTQAGPVVIRVMLEVLQEAFDEVVIKDEDWQEIIDFVAQQASSPQQGQPGQGSPQQGQQGQQGEPGDKDVDALLRQLPQEAKASVIKQIKGGVNPQQALEQMVQQIK